MLAQDEASLRANPNPFAVVVLTALLGIRNRSFDDEQLKLMKVDLYKEMLKRKMDKISRKAIYDFLLRYVSFKDQKMYAKFENEIENQIGRTATMGTREYLLEKAKCKGIEQGIEQGIEKGIEQGELKKASLIVSNLIQELALTDEQIARIAGVSEDFVETVRSKILS